MKLKNNSGFAGKINYGAKVVETIISLATLEINGVEGLDGKKVIVEKNCDMLNIDVFINVSYYATCSDVAFRVQENIKRSVESMTTFKTGSVNVNILGVCFGD